MSDPASPGTGTATANDARFMDRALALAARGIALASPNPMVGAVLVRAGEMIGEGFHTYEDSRHAEVVALDAARLGGRGSRRDKKTGTSEVPTPEAADRSAAARGATLYVTLEPCCHIGRTGPCTQAVIAAGIKRVVAAMEDPNPKVAGRGFRQLRDAGIEVTVGLREAEARRLNEAFARWVLTQRPLVTLKSALTLDGSLVLPQRGGKKPAPRDRWISSAESREEVQRMRHASDALLTGIGTILADDPLLTDRTGLPRGRKLLRVMLDSRLRLPLGSKVVRSADNDVLVFTRAKEDSTKARALRRAGVEVVRLAGRGLRPDLGAAVAQLGRRQILSVLLEAGAILNSAALSAGIVDKIRIFVAPKISGFAGNGHESASGGFRAPQELQNVTVEQFGPDFSIQGYLHDVYRTR